MTPTRNAVARPLRKPNRRAVPALLALALLAHPSLAATIVVAPPCTLADAIDSANLDTSIGDCTAGSGADTILLTDSVTLVEELPKVSGDVVIDGAGFSVSRDPLAPLEFPVFTTQGGSVEYRDLTISGGSGVFAGGIDSASRLTLVDTTVSGNDGNGIYTSSTVTIERSTISDNTGDGLYTTYALVDIVDSTISGNAGTGVVVGEYSEVALTNSTISGNDTGIAEAFFVFYPYVDMYNTTIAGNRIGFDVSPQWNYAVQISRSIFGHNLEANCGSFFFVSGPGNLADELSCSHSEGEPIGRLSGLSPNLVDAGGPTRVHGLRRGSSAIDAAGDCGLETDQRGYLRQPGRCDSGAYEWRGRPADSAVDE